MRLVPIEIALRLAFLPLNTRYYIAKADISVRLAQDRTSFGMLGLTVSGKYEE